MLTEDNFKHYVGYQELSSPCGIVYLLDVSIPDDWTKEIGSMSIDEVLVRLDENYIPLQTLAIQQYPAVCDRTLEQVVNDANYLFQNHFPVTSKGQTHAENDIAMKSRRGIGNRKIDNIVLYKGNNEFDTCLVIAKCTSTNKYGLVKHSRFENYGFVLV